MLNIVKDISTVLSLFVVIVTIITVTIPNLRGKLISWLTKTSNTNENINEIKRQLSYDFSDLFLKYGSEKSIRESYLTHLKIISKNHNKKSANSLF